MKKSPIFSAFKKMLTLLTREDKKRWAMIAAFSCVMSFLEIVTAAVISIFASVLADPVRGMALFERVEQFVGVSFSLTPHRVVLNAAALFGGVYLLKSILGITESFFQQLSIQKICSNFRKRLLQRYACMDYGHYLTRNSSFYANTVEQDTFVAFVSCLSAVSKIVSEGAIALSLSFVVIFLNPVMTCACFTVVAFAIKGFSKLVLPIFSRLGKRYLEEYQLAQEQAYQFFHGLKELILLGKRDYFIGSYQRHCIVRDRLYALKMASSNTPHFLIEFLLIGLFVVAVVSLCQKEESLTRIITALGAYLYAGFRFMPCASRIATQTSILESSVPAIECIYEEFQQNGVESSLSSCQNLTFHHCVTLNNVHFQYLSAKQEVLSDISLSIQKGEKIGIVGSTGSGKSTLIDLLLGLLVPQSGTITVDDRFPVASFEWHRHIGYVPQTLYLLDGTIAENIAFGCEQVDLNRLNQVIDQAQLRSFVETVPLKEQNLVGERGIRLSGGERQRIAVARALYNNPDVLIFDEATSALDNTTEANLMETIYQVSQGRTMIVVAHRLTTLKDCDRIVVMNHGKIEKIVKYEELI
ncbi:MAG: ABC transporter ATP-binding protein/permease [Holosporales bacterium]|nr:ABC transporter ATP-binding protein/permease [Holosporales bacterium]